MIFYRPITVRGVGIDIVADRLHSRQDGFLSIGAFFLGQHVKQGRNIMNGQVIKSHIKTQMRMGFPLESGSSQGFFQWQGKTP